jgi:bifunctional oligoribonuclease and PAP phosphatase NrnA
MPSAITRAITDAKTVLLTTTELDGDAVGSIVALALAIQQKWPQIEVRAVTHEVMLDRYSTLLYQPDLFSVAREERVRDVDVAIVLDGDPDRLGDAEPHYNAARCRGIIDHHKTSANADCDVAYHDATAASTTELILELCDEWGVELTQEIAGAIYAGMVFDTSIFRYRLTSPRTLRGAARLLETGIDHAVIVEEVLLQQKAEKVRLRGRMIDKMHLDAGGRLAWSALTADEVNGTETGGLVDDLVFVEGVEVGVLLVARQDGTVKLSLRSRGNIDVSELARTCNPLGGGHARAAGALMECPLEEATLRTVDAAAAALTATSA